MRLRSGEKSAYMPKQATFKVRIFSKSYAVVFNSVKEQTHGNREHKYHVIARLEPLQNIHDEKMEDSGM